MSSGTINLPDLTGVYEDDFKNIEQFMKDSITLTVAHASVTVTSASTAAATEYNPFDADNHASFASTANVTAQDVTFTSTDGKFTITTGGIYRISFGLIITTAANQNVTIKLKKSGTVIWTGVFNTATDNDPIGIGTNIIVSASADAFFEVTVDGASGNINTENGTIFTIDRIN